MKKTFAIFNTIALIATIAINYLSNTGMITGNTMKTISDRYNNYFTPAGYAFSIWGVIYLGLAGFAYYGWRTVHDRDNQTLTKISWWFVISCIANSVWVMVWLSDELLISVGLMLLLFTSLLIINQNINAQNKPHQDWKTLLMVKWPFAIYFGWVSVALIANVAALLTKLNWDGWGITGETWTVIMLVTAGLVNLLVLFIKKLNPFGVVGAWAVIAIAVANNSANGSNTVVYTCYGVAACLIFTVVINLLGRKTQTSL